MEETLVAELIMKQGLDATMIGPIEHVQPEDTDFICISSFQHSFVVLSWLEIEEVDRHWKRLGLAGQVASTSRASPADSGKKIFHIQLQEGTSVERVIQQVHSMLEARQTKVVPIGLGLSPGMGSAPSPAKPPQPKPAPPKPNADSASEARSKPTKANATKTPQVADTARDSEADVSEKQQQNLDQLVDDFDALDL